MVLKEEGYNVQGVDLLQVAKDFGSPLYVYDGDKISSQFKQLKNAFGEVNLKLKNTTI